MPERGPRRAARPQPATPALAFARWLGSHRPVGAGYTSPADKLVRVVFGMPENAASYLNCMLPPEVAAQLDMRRMIPVPATLIDSKHRQDYTDVLFTVPLGDEQAFAHILYGQRGSRHASVISERACRFFDDSYEQFIKVHGQAGCRLGPPQLLSVGYVTGGGEDG